MIFILFLISLLVIDRIVASSIQPEPKPSAPPSPVPAVESVGLSQDLLQLSQSLGSGVRPQIDSSPLSNPLSNPLPKSDSPSAKVHAQ